MSKKCKYYLVRHRKSFGESGFDCNSGMSQIKSDNNCSEDFI